MDLLIGFMENGPFTDKWIRKINKLPDPDDKACQINEFRSTFMSNLSDWFNHLKKTGNKSDKKRKSHSKYEETKENKKKNKRTRKDVKGNSDDSDDNNSSSSSA